ncbi:MAG: PilZ domain-containing protein, partial [Planctomycetota bacterium]
MGVDFEFTSDYSTATMSSDQETRRAHPRRSVANVEMFCYRASPSATPQMRRNIGSEILDISQGGARVRVNESVGRGETITLELRDRASGESFRARGEVRWAVSAGLGHLLGVHFSEHYTPLGVREAFTVASTPESRAAAAAAAMGQD